MTGGDIVEGQAPQAVGCRPVSLPRLEHNTPVSRIADRTTTRMSDDWSPLIAHYESCLAAHGRTPRGVDWPNARDLEVRFSTLLSLLDSLPHDPRPVVLDLGCGPGLLLDYLHATRREADVDYQGVDRSPAMIAAARARWPAHAFSVRDVVSQPLPDGSVDVVVMNGVLTEKVDLDHDAMASLARTLIRAAFASARVGIAFNVMSRHVDRQRADLFHWAHDDLAAFLTAEISRHYTFRADYGLYEYAVFVHRHPQRPSPLEGEWWQS